jgi:hypothetical protein
MLYPEINFNYNKETFKSHFTYNIVLNNLKQNIMTIIESIKNVLGLSKQKFESKKATKKLKKATEEAKKNIAKRYKNVV